MEFQLSRHEISILIRHAACIGATITLTKLGHIRAYINLSQARKRYGRKNVDSWIGKELVSIRKDGDASAGYRLDVNELEAVSRAQDILRRFL